MSIRKGTLMAFACTVGMAFSAVATTVATATWTGGGDRSNPNDLLNWSCKDSGGSVIKGAVPTDDTVVTISGETDFQLPLRTQIHAKKLVFENVKLTQDADWQGTLAPLPQTCEELEYIDAKKEAYFDTDFVANQDTRLVMTLQPKESWEYWFGVWSGGQGVFSGGYCTDHFLSAYWKYASDDVAYKEEFGSVPRGVLTVADLNKNTYTVTTNGVQVYRREYAYGEFSTGLPIFLLARNERGTAVYGYGETTIRLYSCQIYDDGEIVRNFVPARFKNAVGLYDKVEKKFYPNAGTGPMTGGNAVAGADPLKLDSSYVEPSPVSFDATALIDVNGHALTIDGATLTESASGATVTSKIADGVLVVNVAADSTVNDNNLSFTDKLRVVKDGDGVLQMLHGGHTFTGGLDVNGGTLQPTRDKSCSDGGVLGKNNWSYAKINVNEGGTYDINGSYGCWGYCFVANGGTLVNTYSRFHDKTFYDTRLKVDTVFNVEKDYALNGDQPQPMDYGLGGNTLTINISEGQTLRASWVQFHDGKVVINGEGTFSVKATGFDVNNNWGNTPCDCGGASARLDTKTYPDGITPIDLELNAKCDLQKPMTVRTLTIGDGGSIVGTASIGIAGYYLPVAQTFPNLVMQAGSKLDLTDVNGTFSVYGKLGEADTKVAFAETGTITVDVTGRNLNKGDLVIAWNVADKPKAAFKFAGDDMAAVVMDDGLHYGGDEGSTEVVSAEWTGAANNGKLDDPGNWTCYNPSGKPVDLGLPTSATKVRLTGETLNIVVPAGTDFECDSCTIVGSKTLTANCDLSGFGNIIFDEGMTFDVGEYELKVGKSFFATSTSRTVKTTTAGGTLKVVVDENEEIVNSIVAFVGKLKLVKYGLGVFETSKQYQEFTGGIEVVEGTLRGTTNLSVGDYKPFGPSWNGSGSNDKKDWCTVTVRKGATYDVNGSIKFWGVLMVLDGGTLHNTIARTGDISIDDVRLTADSTLDISEDWHLWSSRESLDEPSYFNLGGHKLTVNIAAGKTLDSQWGKFANGTLEVNGGTLKIRNDRDHAKYPLDSGRDDLDLVINTALVMENQMSVRTFTLGANGSISGTAPFLVAGTWKPEADDFPNIVMKNGSTLDLTGVNGVFNTACTKTGCSLTCAANSVVTVDVHGRDLTQGEQIIAWTDKPAADFVLDAASAESGVHIAATSEGLFYGGDPTSKEVDVAYWTGAADADVGNFANWACTNSSGYVVEEGVPDKNSKIHFASPTMHVDISKNFECALFSFDTSTTLTGDSDLTGVGTIIFAEGVTIDLDGHTLKVGEAFFNATTLKTVTSETEGAVLEAVIGEGSTVNDNTTQIDGKLKLVKSGAGLLEMLKGKHNFNGGLDINGGTLRPLAKNSCCDFGRLGLVRSPASNWNWTYVHVNEGGTYDINGSHSFWGYRLIVNGGTMANAHDCDGFGQCTFYDTTLASDTVFDVTGNYPLNGDRTYPMDYNLGGHTLTVNISKDKTLCVGWMQFHDGTVVVNGEGTFRVQVNGYDGENKWDNTPCNCGGVDFRLDPNDYQDGIQPIDLTVNGKFDLQKAMTVHDFTCNATKMTGAATMTVLGTFKPLTLNFPSVELADGATIDVGAFNVALAGDAFTFADGATIYVSCGDRELSGPTEIVSWSKKPANYDTLRFKVVPELKQLGWKVLKNETGLQLKKEGFTVYVK